MAHIKCMLFFLISAFLAIVSPAAAQSFVQVDVGSVIICPATGRMPTFDEPECTPSVDNRVDTQNRHIWLKASIQLSDTLRDGERPLAVFVSAKAASRVFLNGVLIGNNGKPGSTAAEEVPGKMDASFYIDRSLLHDGENHLVLELSGQHSLLDLAYPVHVLGVGLYADPLEFIMRGYISSLLPLGILVAGALYFGVLALRRRENLTSILVPLIALFAAGQLLAEVSRGFVAYSYPFQDIRLLLVLGFAVACGLCLLLHLVDRFVTSNKVAVVAAALVFMVGAIFWAPGFDGKSVMAVLVPAVVGATLAGRHAVSGDRVATAYTIALFLFALLTIPAGFLDIYFYYIVAGLLLFLFTIEIRKMSEEKRLRAEERARADRLQLALDESREQTQPSQISISSQGKVEIISSDTISVCRAARDYVELEVEGRGPLLYDSSLSELEAALPAIFLRVHRSYIVNTRFIRSLERDNSGSGRLILTTDAEVPVSRRILPKVRKALA